MDNFCLRLCNLLEFIFTLIYGMTIKYLIFRNKELTRYKSRVKGNYILMQKGNR